MTLILFQATLPPSFERYKEAGDFFKQAVELQPDHWEAHIYLGQNYLRLNNINDAIRHVNISYEGDAFNPMTVNMLRLLDTFNEDFVANQLSGSSRRPLARIYTAPASRGNRRITELCKETFKGPASICIRRAIISRRGNPSL